MARRTAPDRRTELLGELLALAPMLRQMVAAGLERRRLTQPRVRLLLALFDDGPQVMSRLGHGLGVTPRNVTGLVDGLERAGLARRGAHPTDRRATVVDLTPAGRRTCRSLRAGYERFADELLTGLAPADLAATSDVLARVRTRLEARAQ